MTVEEFHQLCKTTRVGTALTFRFGNEVISGHFVGCGRDEIVIEANGKQLIWPRELLDMRITDYPTPSYS